MKIFGFLSLLMLMLFSCKEDRGSYHGGYYWIYGYGLPAIEKYEAMAGISEKWKIKHYSAGDCLVEPDEIKRIDALNKRTYAAIERKYGKGWREEYRKDVDGFVMKSADVMDILITNQIFRNELEKYNIEIYNLDKEILALNDKEDFRVVVYNHKLQYENKECFRVMVNTKNRTVNLIK
ncbi:hypothetical protein [Chryseobacterium sp. MEBOG07]|uniref:FEKKY domain-containing protein n=1 Tax=Chryseobacterium sp. MEBOG07 TaxID=2879939 RepID=UPI001F2E5B02|nr:hypothetical protein [Chryseobacterium sp. MEBOG07]UKB77225.1 hypothetical protein LF886_11960 [Chryseobacterium sp. MEBOG07]